MREGGMRVEPVRGDELGGGLIPDTTCARIGEEDPPIRARTGRA